MTPRPLRCDVGRCSPTRSASVTVDMINDPDRLRTQVAALLADLPGQEDAGDLADCDIDTVAARLEQAHDLLVQALAAVERG